MISYRITTANQLIFKKNLQTKLKLIYTLIATELLYFDYNNFCFNGHFLGRF